MLKCWIRIVEGRKGLMRDGVTVGVLFGRTKTSGALLLKSSLFLFSSSRHDLHASSNE